MQITKTDKVDFEALQKGVDDLRSERFEKWWNRIGRRFSQSLMVVSENMTVKEKMRQVYNSGWCQES